MELKNKNQLKKQLLFLLFAFMLISQARAQSLQYNYLVALPENSAYNDISQPKAKSYELKIVMGDQRPTALSVGFASGAGGVSYSSSQIASLGSTLTIPFTSDQIAAAYLSLPVTGTPGALGIEQPASPKFLTVTSTGAPITVYAMAQAYASTDATNVLLSYEYLSSPLTVTPHLGTEYYCINYSAYGSAVSAGSGLYNAKAGYMIVSMPPFGYSSTDIFETDESGVETKIATLGSSQSLCRYIIGNPSGKDLTGRRIRATNPIACFAMTTMSNIPFGSSTNDVLYEQLRPVEQWGRHFVIPMIPGLSKHRIRVVAKEATNLSVSGATLQPGVYSQPSLSNLQAGQFVELELSNDGGNNGCFITADKPVSVCAFMTTGNDIGTSTGDPAQVWIPPVEQMDHNVMMATFPPSNSGNTALTKHYALIVTPTATKTATTWNGSTALLSTYTWYDVPNSGYSFMSVPIDNPGRQTFDNPGGVIVYGYGIGDKESYYYVGGCGTDDLTNLPGFTVNGDDYTEADGKIYCDVNSFNFAAYNYSPYSVSWNIQLNGTSYSTPSGPNASLSSAPDGDYTVTMTVNGRSFTTHFHVGIVSVVWTPEANTGGTDADKQNWDIAANWTPSMVPTACNHVYIPGNCNYYPQLTNPEECNNIYFMQGGELGRVDLLTYKKAFIQYNFGLKQSTQSSSSDKNLVLQSGSTTVNRLQYSAAVSSNPLTRERWYLLTNPLKSVVTGDFDYGGFPLSFLRKFSIVNSGGVSTGSWTTPFNSMVEPLSAIEGAFAFYMYGWGNAFGDNSGCYELGSYNDPSLNDMTYLPHNRNSLNYGLKQTNGILELPFFADSTNLIAHRTQVYNQPALNQSTFYYIYDYTSPEPNTLTGDKDPALSREANNGNYHFYGESYNTGTNKWTSTTSLSYSGNVGANQEFLVGNPYISSLDMVSFLRDSYNNGRLLKQYRIWNGTSFTSFQLQSDNTFTYSSPPTVTNPGYIAPLQAFLVKTTASFSPGTYGSAHFESSTMSKVRPIGSPSNLRNATETKEENILRIKAENEDAASYALIGYREGANNDFIEGEDVSKLFSPLNEVPEVYSLAGHTPTDINFISNKGDIIVPLGIKTGKTGEIRLTFTGMDNYTEPTKIMLLDAFENHTIDISGIPSYTYTFNNTETGIQNGRFSLRFGFSETALPEVINPNDLKVYKDSRGIYVISSASDPILQVTVYDLQGRKMYESTSGANYYPVEDNLKNSPLIVKVRTHNQTKTVKLNSLN